MQNLKLALAYPRGKGHLPTGKGNVTTVVRNGRGRRTSHDKNIHFTLPTKYVSTKTIKFVLKNGKLPDENV